MLILVTNTSEHEQLQSLQNAFLIMCSQGKTSTACLSTLEILYDLGQAQLCRLFLQDALAHFSSVTQNPLLFWEAMNFTQSLPPGAIIHFSSLSRNSSKSRSNVTFVIPSLDLPSTVSHFVKLTVSLNKGWFINRNASSLLIQNRD